MYDAAVNDTVPSFNRDVGIKDILKCKSKAHILNEPSIEPTTSFRPKLIAGTQIPFPGFPSLNVLPLKSTDLKPIGLNCFGFPSKYATTVLTLQSMPENLPGAAVLADNIIGKSLYINWPMMHEAKVVAISDQSCTIRMDNNKKKKVVMHTEKEAKKWEDDAEAMSDQYFFGMGQPGSGGVNIGSVQIRLKLVSLQGMKVSPSTGASKKFFGTEEADVPLQMVLWQSPAPDPRFEERGPMTLKDRFPPQRHVVLTKGKYRGCVGNILNVVGDKIGVKVEVSPPEPPFGLAIARTVQESYINTADAAKVLKMNSTIFAKITGSLFFQPGNYDLGLNLKYKRDFCVLGYSRRRNKNRKGNNKVKKAWGTKDTVLVVGNQPRENTEDDKNTFWEYTPKTVKLVAAFRQKFPKLFSVVSKTPNAKKYDARVLGSSGVKELKEIRQWLNNVETAKMPRTPCSTEEMPHTAIAAVQRAADVRVAEIEKEDVTKHANLKIPAAALYLEGSTLPTDVLHHADGESPELGDRVVNLCANGLPFGARGTIVGIHKESTGCVEVVMDKEFIGGSTLQGSCSNFRGKLCVWNHLLKVNASNSMDIVEKMIPAGSGRSAVEKNLASVSVQNEMFDESKDVVSAPVENNNTQVSAKTPQRQKNAWKQPSPSRVRGGKQGAWREALGPSKKGIGFKGADRGGKSGLQAWKELFNSNTDKIKKSSADDGLKAMLGVKNQDSTDEKKSTSSSATDGLKNMLGIASTLPDTSTSSVSRTQQLATGATSAADALIQLMMVQEPPMATPQQLPQQSQFNFTYVNEGEAQQPTSMMGPPGQHAPPFMYPPNMNGYPPHIMPHQMHYPPMTTQQTMMMAQQQQQQRQQHEPVVNDSIPVNRSKKETNGMDKLPLIPSIAVKAKK